MGTTAINGLPFPELSDVPDVPQDIEDLANAIDNRVIPRFATATARNNAITSPVAGQVVYVTDPGSSAESQLQLYTGSTWVEVPPRRLFVMKTADESVTSSTAFQDDNDLVLALAANTRYRFDFYAVVFGNAAEDIKFRYTYPTGATVNVYGGIRIATNSTNHVGDFDSGTYVNDTGSPTDEIQMGSPNNAGTLNAIGHMPGIITMGATAGNFRVQWAGIAGGFTVTLKAGSWLEAYKV